MLQLLKQALINRLRESEKDASQTRSGSFPLEPSPLWSFSEQTTSQFKSKTAVLQALLCLLFLAYIVQPNLFDLPRCQPHGAPSSPSAAERGVPGTTLFVVAIFRCFFAKTAAAFIGGFIGDCQQGGRSKRYPPFLDLRGAWMPLPPSRFPAELRASALVSRHTALPTTPLPWC